MRTTLSAVLIGAVALVAAQASAQTAKKPVQTQATKPAATKAAVTRPAARPAARPAPRAAVYVPPPPVVELDENAVVADLPTVLDNETRDRYRRIFQAQQSGNWTQADEDIRQLQDKTLMGYVGAQRLLSPSTRRATTSSPPGCRNTTTTPMRPPSTSWRWRAARRADLS